MNCSRNDVVLLPIPFTDLTSRKVRAAIVIGVKAQLSTVEETLAVKDIETLDTRLRNWLQL